MVIPQEEDIEIMILVVPSVVRTRLPAVVRVI
jgi:hypothetical protein